MQRPLRQRILGLDVGTKRIGIVVSDPLGIFATPLKTIERQPEEKSMAQINEICKEYDVSDIVVGLPKNMDGTVGFQAEDCQNFANRLKETFNFDIIFEDERLTSRQAEMYLSEQKKKYTKDKGLVDIVSASIILQQYLDRRRN